MKVLMINHPGTLKFRGGDLTQMRKTAEAMEPMGVACSESFDAEPNAKGFDLVHFFNLRTTYALPKQVNAVRKHGVPIVMSPIYLNPSVALWANRVIKNIFGATRTTEELNRLLDDLRNRSLSIGQQGKSVWTAASQNRSEPEQDAIQRQVLQHIDHLLPNSYLEMDQLRKTLLVADKPFTFVPYACDPSVFNDPDPEPFIKQHGLRDFVLQVGRIEWSKNQLMLAMAVRELDLPIVLIGTCLQPDYLALCKKHGPRNLTVIQHLPAEQLRSAYAAAKVHVLPSWIETCGLVTMEAALADCSVVTSIAGHEIEYFREFPYYCDPGDTRSISRAVVRAFDNYAKDGDRRSGLRDLILRDYTWERAAQLTLAAYKSVLSNK